MTAEKRWKQVFESFLLTPPASTTWEQLRELDEAWRKAKEERGCEN